MAKQIDLEIVKKGLEEKKSIKDIAFDVNVSYGCLYAFMLKNGLASARPQKNRKPKVEKTNE